MDKNITSYSTQNLDELFKSEEKDLQSFIESFQSKLEGEKDQKIVLFTQEQAFSIVNKHIADLKKGKRLKEFCTKNDIHYRSLISLSYSKNKKSDHQPDLKTSPILILKLMKLIYKNVELKKEIYYKVITEQEAE